jgi:hypothetical protein
MVRRVESHAAGIEIGCSREQPSPEIASAAAAVLAAERPSHFQRKHPRLWPAVESARDRRAKLIHVLNTHGFPIEYVPFIQLWFFDAVDFRHRAEEIQSDLEPRMQAVNRRKAAIEKFRDQLRVDEELGAGLERRGMDLNRLMWAMEEQIVDCEEEPQLLEYLYFVSSKRGHRKTGQGRELHAVLMNLVGMWKEVKGQFPQVQPNLTKTEGSDEAGDPSPTAFIALVRDLAEVLGHRYPLSALQYAARMVVKELRMHSI